MSAQDLFSRFDAETFKAELEKITTKFNEVSVSSFQNRRCKDCGARLKTFGAVRCNQCNMRRIGKRRKK